MKMLKYCYREPIFPVTAFMAFMTVTTEPELSSLYPFEYLYTDLAAFEKEAESFTDHFAAENLNVSEEALLVPLTFLKNVPLKPKYWKKSKNNRYYHTNQRMQLFNSMLKAPLLYSVLVTPSGFVEKKTEFFSVAIPIPQHSITPAVEQFMMQSDYPVESSAKSAALYSPGKPFGINWRSHELIGYVPTSMETSN